MAETALMDVQKQEDLLQAFTLADKTVSKTWLKALNQMEIVSCPKDIQAADINDYLRLFKVERFVYEKNENIRDKLVSVFHSVASCGGSMVILIDSDGKKVNYHFGTKVAVGTDGKVLRDSAAVLEKSLAGNFPGTKITGVKGSAAVSQIRSSVFKNKQFGDQQQKQVCTVTGVAGLRAEEESHEKRFVQGMEKLVDTMQGETYSLLLIADPVTPGDMEIIKRGYENLYSQLVPFSGSEVSYGQNESGSVADSITSGLSEAIGESVTDTLTHTTGTSTTHSEGTTDTKNKRGGTGWGAAVGSIVGTLLLPGIGTMIGGAIGGAAGNLIAPGGSKSTSITDGTGTNQSDATAHGVTTSTTTTTTNTKGETVTVTTGTTASIQIKRENKTVKDILDKIDLQLERFDASADTGMWHCSAYCLADTASTCKIVASAYHSLLRGENSSVEAGDITEWSEPNVYKLLPWLQSFHHPRLRFANTETPPASLISGAELAIHAGLPQSSVSGLPVLEIAPFGREVSANWQQGGISAYGNKITLGKIYHMGNEESLPVELSKKSLTSHTFITGSTGSGKSNAVYQLLDEIRKNDAAFLVVESAKGEYKNVFGNRPDVAVYGTNPGKSPMLRINPFTFPGDIHVLEHLDRLIEIFNVCWPMYAAMPAVLKDAVEAAYEEAGWDLRSSTNRHSPAQYPAFADVVTNIRRILDSSEYSAESKGDYKGALITRLKSLCNGINGMIFTDEELSNADLFDKNVIVDLSRVGSTETKSLIMGLLVMKLQEYRMTSGEMNADLKHVTVLEEAHNLLKRTSTEQSAEGSNLLGKSVEMLANAIAEMRTYGEGFIIADQSPGLLDMSVIRNTNTKIILRLPDEDDRILVGKAAGLNDDQIVELAKLQLGVAAVYQNDWIQSVLCKIQRFTYDETFKYGSVDNDALAKAKVIAALKGGDVDHLNEKLNAIGFATFKTLPQKDIVCLFPNRSEVIANAVKETKGFDAVTKYLLANLQPSLTGIGKNFRRHMLYSIIAESCTNDPGAKNNSRVRELPERWLRFMEKQEDAL